MNPAVPQSATFPRSRLAVSDHLSTRERRPCLSALGIELTPCGGRVTGRSCWPVSQWVFRLEHRRRYTDWGARITP